MKKYSLIVSLILILYPGISAMAYEFTPELSLSLSEGYNDNIRLTHTNRESDFITYLSPGVSLSLSSPTSQIRVDYTPSFSFYASHSDRNATSHNLAATSFFDLSDKLRLDVNDSFVRSREANSLFYVTNLGPIRNTEELTSNNLNGGITYKIRDNLIYTLGASYIDSKFNTGSSSNETETLIGNMALAYVINERSTVSVNAKYEKNKFRASNDTNTQFYLLGATHRFTPTLTLEMTGGADITEFRGTGKQTTGFTGSASLTKLFEKGRAVLSVAQTVVPGIELAQLVTSQSASLSFSRPLSEFWNAILLASYSRYRSASASNITQTKTDQLLLGTDLSYAIRPWAAITLSYKFIDLSDRIDSSRGYYNNIVLLGLRLSYTRKPQ